MPEKKTKTRAEAILIEWRVRQEDREENAIKISPTAWADLADKIDLAILEAEQRGRDYRKKVQVLKDTSEWGPFWAEFYRRVFPLPGAAEIFGWDGIEAQWNEVIRIKFKSPTLRAVSPETVLDYLRGVAAFDGQIWAIIKEMETIVDDLAKPQGPYVSPFEMGG